MKILKLLSLLSVLCLYTAQSHAQQTDPVTHVYRMDTRHPDTIFLPAQGGFAPWGTNDNIVEHVQDATLQGENAEASIFVSTSANRDWTIQWGVLFQGREEFYIYDIRPTFNFYSAISSFQALYARTGDPRYFNLIDTYSAQEEYSARGGIPVTQIYGAREFHYDPDSGDYVEGEYALNRYYVDIDTAANPTPYTPISQIPREIIVPETYCALNLSMPRDSARFNARTDKYPFLRKLKLCHDSLLTIAFLSAIIP
ncbi:hypothetical protein FE394_08590 [Xenorhabdus sp. Reich]|uniref:Pertussis toxin subunit 1 n=1 Tax=Xenorhabdus littoralis TaxID=2582835 RepID=A0ABU4SKT1_9GAMM|nr:enterotoxin A family protein [Xenorhabdus sp. Reich]MDX7999257.1 hypothetical protein [Xenorhabdus sp. Reich]